MPSDEESQEYKVESYNINDTDLALSALLADKFSYIQLEILTPSFEKIEPGVLILPQPITADENEFVYPIHDFGNILISGKSAEDWFKDSNCRLFYTIEKMICILIDRIKDGGIDTETEVQVNLYGTSAAVRKMFESIINLPYNVVVMNFDPGLWGEQFLKILSILADKGYGLLSPTPRRPFAELPTKAKIR